MKENISVKISCPILLSLSSQHTSNSVNTELDTSCTLPLGSQAPDRGLRRNNSTGLSDFHLVSGVSTSYQPSPPIIFTTGVWLLAALSSLSPAISICVLCVLGKHLTPETVKEGGIVGEQREATETTTAMLVTK